MLPGIFISLGAVIIVVFLVDWHQVGEALKHANPVPLLIGLPIYILSFLFRALAWRGLLQNEPSKRRVFFVMNSGYFLNNLFPFRMGEIGRTILLGSDMGYLRVFSTIMVERTIDMILAASLLLGTLPFVLKGGEEKVRLTGLVVFGIMILLLFLMFLFVRYSSLLKRLINFLFRSSPRFASNLNEKVDAVLQGLSVMESPRKIVTVLGWMIASWLLAVVVQYLFMSSVIPEANLLWGAFALSFSALGIAVPSSPAYVGVYEGVVIGALAFFGVSPSSALAYALIAHVMYVSVTGVFGAIGLADERQSLKMMYRRILNIRFKET